MNQAKITDVKREIESLSAKLSSADTQDIFYDIVFKKKVEEALKEADKGMLTDWNEFKAEMRTWI